MQAAAMGNTISLRYALRLVDGTEILSNFDDAEPDIFTLGDGTLAPSLEMWLMGISEGERHVFLLDPEQAFGLSSPDKIHRMNTKQVSPDTPLELGTLVEFTLPDGQTMAGKILNISAQLVEVDFNHPLADLPLEFEVEIVQFHEALSAGPELHMKKTILLANPRGFCAGVDRAIAIVERALEKFGAPIYVRHEVVHNTYVVNDLKNKGAIFVDELANVPRGSTVIFSAHGVSQAVRTEAEALGLHVFDATCPLVTKVHVEVTKMREQGLEIVMIGHRGHPEVEGTLGQSPHGMYLVETQQDVALLQVNSPDKLAYVTQTTLSVDDAVQVVDALKLRFPGIIGPKKTDICYATQNRQDAVKALAPQCDVVIVVGSPTSSNSNRLREVADNLGVASYMVDSADEIRAEWIAEKNCVGLTAGASAPEILVEAVIARLEKLGVNTVTNLDGVQEKVGFPLPKGLSS